VLRRIFGPKREDVAGRCRRLHNEELHNFCASPNIIRVMKTRRDEIGRACSMHRRDAKHVRFWSEKLKGRDHSEDPGVDGNIILE
jgi:hypothetical protein